MSLLEVCLPTGVAAVPTKKQTKRCSLEDVPSLSDAAELSFRYMDLLLLCLTFLIMEFELINREKIDILL